MAHEDDGLQALQLMKFTELGHHPTEDRALNLLEQVNQTFTYLLSFQAARWVMDQHPEVTALQLNLGPHSGFDIQSLGSSLVAAEVFSATHVSNSDKLKKDIRKLQKDALDYEHRYVFYSCPGHSDVCVRPSHLDLTRPNKDACVHKFLMDTCTQLRSPQIRASRTNAAGAVILTTSKRV